jgi:hypothetical protein
LFFRCTHAVPEPLDHPVPERVAHERLPSLLHLDRGLGVVRELAKLVRDWVACVLLAVSREMVDERVAHHVLLGRIEEALVVRREPVAKTVERLERVDRVVGFIDPRVIRAVWPPEVRR